jgi:hypothetical protein
MDKQELQDFMLHPGQPARKHITPDDRTTVDSPIVGTMLRYAGLVVTLLGLATVALRHIR